MNELIDRFNAVPLTNKIIVLFLLMVVLFGAYFLGLHTPINDEITDLQQQSLDLQERERELQGVQEREEQVRDKISDLQDELLRADDKLPDSAEIDGLVERIYRDAEMQGLVIDTFQRLDEEPAEDGDYIEIPVEMEVVGTFDEVADFFLEVGQRGRIINVGDIQLQRESSDLSADGELRVSARATTYRRDVDQS